MSSNRAPAFRSVAARERVVVVGAGFGGLEAARALARSPVDVWVIDRRNHHLFQPLLYQVATAALSPADIAAPIRKILHDQKNARVVLGEVSGVDLVERTVSVDGRSLPFDWLVIAAGATHSYFARPDWEEHAPGLKTVEDATEIRRRFLLAFERAESCTDESERRALLTFVVVGAGPTGVELAGAMAEIAHSVLPGDFRSVDPRSARVVLMEGQPRVLTSMPEACSRDAARQLTELGVELRMSARVTAIDDRGVVATVRDTPDGPGREERIAARTVLWAAGVQASPLGRSLRAELDGAGRVLVRADLTVPGHDRVFVVGDQAHVVDPRTKQPVPGVAQGALQMGRFAGRTIADEVRAAARGAPRPERASFVYRDKGTLATIGRSRAVAEVNGRHFSGFLAWALWAVVHVTFLIRFRNRLFVLLGWTWSYVFVDRGARLITGAPRRDP